MCVCVYICNIYIQRIDCVDKWLLMTSIEDLYGFSEKVCMCFHPSSFWDMVTCKFAEGFKLDNWTLHLKPTFGKLIEHM